MTASLLSLLAFQNNYGAEAPAAEGPSIVVILCAVAVALVIIAALWKVFEKAGEPGWAVLVPIYNLIVMLKIVGRPAWWILLFLIPAVNLIVSLVVSIDLAKRFGKGTGFGIGLFLVGIIFYPILGFGDARYNPSPAA